MVWTQKTANGRWKARYRTPGGATRSRTFDRRGDANEFLYHAERGFALVELGRYKKAVKAYDRAIELAPTAWALYAARGLALDQLGRYEESVVAFDRAIELDPGVVESHFNKGVPLRNLGRHREALDAFDRAIDLDPGDAQVH
ncbi:MAG: tetratricopeptide repeat protein, partial [Actinomycetota bacterium]|nr:tetratricopeptide repeat protein [Actinomycetota bacterium]